MKKNKCTILIGEDEEIERNSIETILVSHFQDSIQVIVAKNGREALELYQEYLPEIVLMDINMPILNGLEAIEKMKNFHHESTYLILTSYDYFAYAQKAIQLGVEDFLLKPANATQIIATISKALELTYTKYNKTTQESKLLEKYTEMRPTMELQCLYTILSKGNEMQVQKELLRLNILARSCVCFVIRSDQEQEANLIKLKQSIEDVGYACLKGTFNDLFIIYIFSTTLLHKEDAEVLEYLLAQQHMNEIEIGIGAVQNGVEFFYKSYVQARNDLHKHVVGEPLHITLFKTKELPSQNNLSEFVDELFTCFLKQDAVYMHKIVHQFIGALVIKNESDILKEINEVLKKLIHRLEQHFQLEIDQTTLPQIKVQEYQKLQNLEIQLYFILNKLFNPLKNASYHQSNALVKKAIMYIQKNYSKPISLNDLAKELQVTPFYVSKLLKQYNDQNFTDLVSEYRIEKAKHILRNGERVKEVAFMVGFQSQSYFAKTFKKIVGVTPTDYQNMFL